MRELTEDAKRMLAIAGAADEPTDADGARIEAGLRARLGATALVVAAAGTVATKASAASVLATPATVASVASTNALVASTGLGGGLAVKMVMAVVVATATVGGAALVRHEIARPPLESVHSPGERSYPVHEPAKLDVLPPAPSPLLRADLPSPVGDRLVGATAASPGFAEPEPTARRAASGPSKNEGARGRAGLSFAFPERVSPPPVADRPADAIMDPLLAEVRLMQQARTALEENRATDALALLDRYQRAFPEGAFREEQTVARVAALCALEQVKEARLVVDQARRRGTRSAYRAALAESCGSVP